VALVGDLGTGKTSFVKGLGEGLQCRESPSSPTFALIRVHRPSAGTGRAPLRHVDLYRLTPAEIPDLEWDDLLDDKGVTVVEWAEKARRYWPADCLVVGIAHLGENRRSLSFFAGGERSLELVKILKGKGAS
jgi:tRNA threonylcarbamoyladenosine biosynthesis protein TsaE